ncbi:hypothetical protein EVAR_70552_1, partial [Eumeta japonica]
AIVHTLLTVKVNFWIQSSFLDLLPGHGQSSFARCLSNLPWEYANYSKSVRAHKTPDTATCSEGFSYYYGVAAPTAEVPDRCYEELSFTLT